MTLEQFSHTGAAGLVGAVTGAIPSAMRPWMAVAVATSCVIVSIMVVRWIVRRRAAVRWNGRRDVALVTEDLFGPSVSKRNPIR